MNLLVDECAMPETKETLQQLWTVMSNKHTIYQVERQLILLDAYFSVSGNYAKLSDLHFLTRITYFLVGRSGTETCYREPLKKILSMMKYPFKMEKASDEVTYDHNLVEFFTTFGCLLLQSKNRDLQTDILKIVENILLSKREGPDLVSIKACVRCMEVSEFVESLADAISIIEEEDFYQRSIYVTLQVTKLSKFACWVLLTRNVIESLLISLTTFFDENRSEILDTTYQLLWELFNCTNHPNDWGKIPVPSMTALRSLRYVLREEALVHSYPGRYSNGLNNISAIVLKMMHIFPNAEYVTSFLTEDITFFATLTESVIPIHILPYFKNALDHLQFKKLMLACLSLSPISSLTLVLFEFYKVAECLVALLSGGPSCGSRVPWAPEHMIDLFRCTLPVVCALYDHTQKAFIDAGLMKKLVIFIEVHYFDEKHFPDDISLCVVKTIMTLCFRKIDPKTTRDSLIEAGAVPVLLNLCKLVLDVDVPLTLRSQSVLHHSLIVLAKLIENNDEQQNKHSKLSFYVVNTLYKRVLKPLPQDSLTDNRLTVALANFAWEALIWNKDHVKSFIRSGNIFTHIDVMEKSTFSVQLVYLSVLTDLCEYQQCIPYLISWRGRKGLKLLSLLCRIWRDEEGLQKVPRCKQGCISDIERPIMGTSQFELMKRENKKVVAAFDVFGSVRPKIYAIVQLFHRHKEVTELCEEHYRLRYDELPCEDLITLQIIEAYLPFKMGEIWWEIKNKQQDKVLPLDRSLADTLADRYLKWSLNVQRSQHAILRNRDAHVREQEQDLYSTMRSSRLTCALSALREVEQIARTADRQQMLKSHQQLCETIESSRAALDMPLEISYTKHLNGVLVDSNAEVVLGNKPF